MKNLVSKINRIRHIEKYVLACLFALGFVARLYKIENPVADWHSFRQADTASVTRLYVENGINLLYPKYHDISRIQSGLFNPEGFRFVEFPVYNFIHTLLVKSFPFFSLEIWGRLLSIFAALGSAFVIYLLGRRYISEKGGILASGFFLLNPYNIYFTRVILPEPLAVFFALLSLYYFSQFLKKDSDKYLFLCSFTFATSILIKPYTIFYATPLVILYLENNNIKSFLKNKRLLIAGFLAILPLFLWRMWIRQYPEGIPFWKWTFNGDGIRFRPAFWFWIFGERLTKLILGFWGLVVFVAGIISYKKKYIFIHSFIFAMLLFVIVFATASVKHDYYQSITIPAVSLVFSLGVINLWNQKEFNAKLTKIITVFSVFVMLMTGTFQVKEFYKVNHPEIIEAGLAVDRLTPKDTIVIAAYNGDTAFLYQTKRRGWPNVELPINELIEEGAEYYVSVSLHDKQTKEFMEKFATIEKTSNYVILNLKKEL